MPTTPRSRRSTAPPRSRRCRMKKFLSGATADRELHPDVPRAVDRRCGIPRSACSRPSWSRSAWCSRITSSTSVGPGSAPRSSPWPTSSAGSPSAFLPPATGSGPSRSSSGTTSPRMPPCDSGSSNCGRGSGWGTSTSGWHASRGGAGSHPWSSRSTATTARTASCTPSSSADDDRTLSTAAADRGPGTRGLRTVHLSDPFTHQARHGPHRRGARVLGKFSNTRGSVIHRTQGATV